MCILCWNCLLSSTFHHHRILYTSIVAEATVVAPVGQRISPRQAGFRGTNGLGMAAIQQGDLASSPPPIGLPCGAYPQTGRWGLTVASLLVRWRGRELMRFVEWR